jgi:hypothetical protein
VVLGRTPYSRFAESFVDSCVHDGVVITNAASDAVNAPYFQWWLENVVSQSNGGSGFLARAVPFAAPPASGTALTLGGFTNLVTFDNTHNGVAVVAVAGARIDDLRILGGFFGADKQSEIRVDSRGGYHFIRDAFVEFSKGHGIEISQNNYNVAVTGCTVMLNDWNGIVTSADNTLISGCDIFTNGSTQYNGVCGVAVLGGSAEVTGNRSGNVVGGPHQQWGVWCLVPPPPPGSPPSPPANVVVVGNRFDANLTGAVGGAKINVDNLTS